MINLEGRVRMLP